MGEEDSGLRSGMRNAHFEAEERRDRLLEGEGRTEAPKRLVRGEEGRTLSDRCQHAKSKSKMGRGEFLPCPFVGGAGVRCQLLLALIDGGVRTRIVTSLRLSWQRVRHNELECG